MIDEKGHVEPDRRRPEWPDRGRGNADRPHQLGATGSGPQTHHLDPDGGP